VPAHRPTVEPSRERLRRRRLKLSGQTYLTNRYLWPNIEWAVREARGRVACEQPRVLDVGCGNRPYADLFEGCRYIACDNDAWNAEPEVVADALELPFEDSTFDLAFATQVIEHVRDPFAMVRECRRVLCPGGAVVITGPFFWPLHEEPYDFHRFTRYGFESLLRSAGFEDVLVSPDGGDWARFFLSVNLAFPRRWQAPLRLTCNLLGSVLDRVHPSFSLPANYTVIGFA
jgi:SAM-dependent methyltransferase